MADGFDFNLYQQQQASQTAPNKPALGCLGCIFPANLQDTQGLLWGKNLNMNPWMEATIPGLASMSKSQPNVVARIFQQMHEQLAQMNKDGFAQISQAGQGLVAPLPTPSSGASGATIDV